MGKGKKGEKSLETGKERTERERKREREKIDVQIHR